MNDQSTVPEITVKDLKLSLDQGRIPLILDVREPHELAIASLPEAESGIHIPLGQLPQRIDELKGFEQKEIVVYCRSGGRSLMATNYLRNNGFSKAVNLKGGILAWSKEIDPKVAQY
jgi:rhodanese-related sulfurtransferase